MMDQDHLIRQLLQYIKTVTKLGEPETLDSSEEDAVASDAASETSSDDSTDGGAPLFPFENISGMVFAHPVTAAPEFLDLNLYDQPMFIDQPCLVADIPPGWSPEGYPCVVSTIKGDTSSGDKYMVEARLLEGHETRVLLTQEIKWFEGPGITASTVVWALILLNEAYDADARELADSDLDAICSDDSEDSENSDVSDDEVDETYAAVDQLDVQADRIAIQVDETDNQLVQTDDQVDQIEAEVHQPDVHDQEKLEVHEDLGDISMKA